MGDGRRLTVASNALIMQCVIPQSTLDEIFEEPQADDLELRGYDAYKHC